MPQNTRIFVPFLYFFPTKTPVIDFYLVLDLILILLILDYISIYNFFIVSYYFFIIILEFTIGDHYPVHGTCPVTPFPLHV